MQNIRFVINQQIINYYIGSLIIFTMVDNILQKKKQSDSEIGENNENITKMGI